MGIRTVNSLEKRRKKYCKVDVKGLCSGPCCHFCPKSENCFHKCIGISYKSCPSLITEKEYFWSKLLGTLEEFCPPFIVGEEENKTQFLEKLGTFKK